MRNMQTKEVVNAINGLQKKWRCITFSEACDSLEVELWTAIEHVTNCDLSSRVLKRFLEKKEGSGILEGKKPSRKKNTRKLFYNLKKNVT